MAGSLQPPPGVAPKYAGLFIIDFDSALQYRIENEANKNCCKEIMITLQRMLDTHNPYAQLFKHVKDIDEVTHDLQLQFTTSNAFHPGRINAPTPSYRIYQSSSYAIFPAGVRRNRVRRQDEIDNSSGTEGTKLAQLIMRAAGPARVAHLAIFFSRTHSARVSDVE
ncbi:hypothetical protein EVAR_24520_1 [Eumeta japonica]|uniref:Uncharacterized protein n=1 Tax=Eumeta variegata TaxID=151549 RepID=A0A4C1USQ6_EUMVA|nr:hypothetical protein EVAR_24520_1 [Eumeta japonica]